MIEVVFSDSARGSLKMAQHYGDGKLHSGRVGVFIHHEDGSEPTQEEIRAAQQKAEERERRAWESAVPLGGNPGDVFGFRLALSIGGIAEDEIGEERRQALENLLSVVPGRAAEETLENAKTALTEILARAETGELVRIWYSNQPEEMCGLYWFLAQLERHPECQGPVSAVKLPEWEEREDGNLERKTGWGDVAPGEWHRYLPLEKPLSTVFRKSCAAHWRELQKENAPLRAVLNGQLISAPEDLYDSFIRREIQREQGEFWEAKLIGQVLGKYQLGIGDAWLALRIEEMLRQGGLEAVTEPEADDAVYRRYLRKLNLIN